MHCPADEQLAGFIDGRLPEEFCRNVEAHLLNCYACQSRLPELEIGLNSAITSLHLDTQSRFDFVDEPECLLLLEFGKSLPDQVHQTPQRTTIVVDPSEKNRGIPDAIGRYQIVRHLGSGSFGTVLLARDGQLDRHVAIKIAHPNRIKTPADSLRYQREAKLLARMEHPNIVPVHDSGLTDEGLVYIVFRFIRGSDLAEMLRPERFPVERTIQLTIQIAEALHYMHSHGIVHRDIKPANILMDHEGVPYLTDFGLAIQADQILDENEIVGTVAYMSPEQLSGDGHLVGPRSDIFSLGVLLFEMLTGKRPFKDRKVNSPVEWMLEAPSPCDLDPSIPIALGRICQKALQSRSGDRFSSTREFAKELQSVLSESAVPSANKSITPVYRGLRAFRRDDQEFFTDLIPGLRSSQGHPEPVQFWLNRMGGSPGEYQPRIGVIYGTTGSGKSSLVDAAILPKLSDQITKITIQASSARTESDLSIALKKVFLGSEQMDSLPDLCRHIRMREPPFANKQILIVIDQFEQWLQGRQLELNLELVQALRQCDGTSIQCLLIVRDDFWVELSKFMRLVEEPMREGENMMAIEPFSVDHAKYVLSRIGEAVTGQHSDQQTRKTFIERGINLIQADGHVSPVRLSLFIEITKELPWEAETLRHFNDLKTLAKTYLKQRFDPDVCPRRFRPHTRAIKLIMAALLPERGNEIKGQGRSLEELQFICGYEKNPERFKQLIEILDRELRVISPVQRSDSDSENTSSRHYQLTHDYLVPAIRFWLDEVEVRTYQGRARIKLRDRTALWSMTHESRQLPGFGESLHILTGTIPTQWNPEEARLMKSSLRRLAIHSTWGIAALLILGAFFLLRAKSDQEATLLAQLSHSSIQNVPQILSEIDPRLPGMEHRIRTALAAVPIDSPENIRLELARLRFDATAAGPLKQYILKSGVEEFPILAAELLQHQVTFSEFNTLLEQPEISSSRKFRAACLLLAASLQSEHLDTLAHEVVSGLMKQTIVTVPEWSDWLFPYRAPLIDKLHRHFQSETSFESSQSAAMVLSVFLRDDPSAYVKLLLSANDTQMEILCEAVTETPAPYVNEIMKWVNSHSNIDLDAEVTALVNAVTALTHLGSYQQLEHYFQRHANPTVRNLLIEKFAATRTNPQYLLELLQKTEHPAVIAALLKTFGTYYILLMDESLQDDLRQIALELFRTHPDSEVHSSALWLLTRLGETPSIPASDAISSDGSLPLVRDWIITNSGDTLIIPSAETRTVIINPHAEQMQSEFTELQVNWSFAIAAKEVTIAQYLLFNPEHPFQSDDPTTPNSPINRVNLESAMSYCNWLTLKEGMTVDDQCYEVINGRVLPKIAFLESKGFRLPLEMEWEVAARGGVSTRFHFGDAPQILSRYSWYLGNSENEVHPVGLLKPNQIGLFDVCGNVSEWCHDMAVMENVPSRRKLNSAAPFRGGSFQSFASAKAPLGSLRVGESIRMSRNAAIAYTGFRIAKTIQSPLSQEQTNSRR